MALIILPNQAVWDTSKDFQHQTTQAQEYFNSLIDPTNMVIDNQEEIGATGSGKYRWLQRHIDDGANDLRIIQTREYVHPPDHAASGMVCNHGGSIQIIY